MMYTTELTPILPKKSSFQYSKYLLKPLLLLILLIALVFAIHYIESETASLGHPRNDIKAVVDEVTIVLDPEDIYYLESVDKNTYQWDAYHLKIIEDHDYDPINKSIIYTFTMHDYYYDVGYFQKYLKAYHGDHGQSITKRKRRPTPNPTRPPTISGKKTSHPTTDSSTTSKRVANGGLRCYAKYSFNVRQNSNGYVLSCNSDGDTLVGCVGGSTHRVTRKRSGEKAVYHGCIANGETIYTRCCYPDDSRITMTGKVSTIQYDPDPNFPVYQLNSFCQTTELAGFAQEFKPRDNYYMIGCTGWTGTTEPFDSALGTTDTTQTTKMLGTRLSFESKGQSYCTAHRGDKKGFIAAPAIVVSVEKAELDCILVESEETRKPDASTVNSGGIIPEWAAMAFCTSGYSLMDCSGYIEGAMDCKGKWSGKDSVTAVVFHGTDLKCMPDREQHCSANGNTDKIRVQASCCRIIK